MNFLQIIFQKLAQQRDKPILYEIHGSELVATTCGQLLADICRVHHALGQAGLRPGDRCALLGPNSSRWVAFDLAIMAGGGIAVPLYSRQDPDELVQMMKDCAPRLLCCSEERWRQTFDSGWKEAPRILTYDQILETNPSSGLEDSELAKAIAPLPEVSRDDHPVTIIYTSGTSGEPKGVVLNVKNLNFMLERTTSRLEELMAKSESPGEHRVFHYLPFCFAASWMTLLSCLVRNNSLMISMDLNRLADEILIAAPHYFVNVPAVLERVRNGVSAQIHKKGGIAKYLFERGQEAWFRDCMGRKRRGDDWWLVLARCLLFPKIKYRFGPNLRALICGSAPLAEETQQFFKMIGIPVLQVYGLTETTAICTMDKVDSFTPGRVGPAIPGIEMLLGINDEILVRGPNVFPGYWNRPRASAEMLREGWLHTGDQGEIDAAGNWRIIGRLKNLIITSGGHNISPEPIEQKLQVLLPEAEHVMVVGNGRKFISALITGQMNQKSAAMAVEKLNLQLPHYKQVRRFYLCPEPFSEMKGFLTVNRKLRRSAIEEHYREEIEALYLVASQPIDATGNTNRE
ncbi:MAG TPA: AMP-binding protein [Terriglobia bacterium]|nr:AMP-binding protein [Terriglobia bacterium]